MQTRKCHAEADANRIHTKNNMSPSPLVGGGLGDTIRTTLDFDTKLKYVT